MVGMVVAVELIDTLWNVNYIAARGAYLFTRINRYIMECKFDREEIVNVIHD